jgi:hypothetical protein
VLGQARNQSQLKFLCIVFRDGFLVGVLIWISSLTSVDNKPKLHSSSLCDARAFEKRWTMTDDQSVASTVSLYVTNPCKATGTTFIECRGSHEKWLSGYTHHTCGRRPEVRIPGVSSSALLMSALAVASLLCSPHLWQGGLRHELQLSISRVLYPPASYIGPLACQDGYIARRWIKFDPYDNLRKISSNLL